MTEQAIALSRQYNSPKFKMADPLAEATKTAEFCAGKDLPTSCMSLPAHVLKAIESVCWYSTMEQTGGLMVKNAEKHSIIKYDGNKMSHAAQLMGPCVSEGIKKAADDARSKTR